jgi:hypothetical protein
LLTLGSNDHIGDTTGGIPCQQIGRDPVRHTQLGKPPQQAGVINGARAMAAADSRHPPTVSLTRSRAHDRRRTSALHR